MPAVRASTIIASRVRRNATSRAAARNSSSASRHTLTSAGAKARPVAKARSGRAAGTGPYFSRDTLEASESLDVMGVGEEAEEVEGGEAPTRPRESVRAAGQDYGSAGQ